MRYLDDLATFAAGVSLERLPAAVVDAARWAVLDTLGAMLAGSRLPENTRLAALAAERGRAGAATLVGHGATAEPMLAALSNATAGVALEVDEGHRWGGGHPAIHTIPAALAVAEERRASGRAFLEAVVAGYEITSRIGGATTPRPNVHSHGTWGTLGAAVAVARLEEMDAGETRRALNVAASMTPANSWTPCFEGATIRNVYPGRSGLQGILAVHLVRCGFTGLADGPSDVYGTILADRFEPEQALEGLGTEYRITTNYFKLHACCLFNHPALDALAALRAATPFEPDEVASITVTSVPFAARMADPAPATMLSAKFSIPHAVAALLVTGRSDVQAFLDRARNDPAVRDLAGRVEVRGDAEMSMRRPGHPQATVAVRLTDGRTLEGSTTVVRGDAANPAPREALLAKFRGLAAPVVGEGRVERIIEAAGRLEAIDIATLTRPLRPGRA